MWGHLRQAFTLWKKRSRLWSAAAKSMAEVKSFLQLLNYYGHFMPNWVLAPCPGKEKISVAMEPETLECHILRKNATSITGTCPLWWCNYVMLALMVLADEVPVGGMASQLCLLLSEEYFHLWKWDVSLEEIFLFAYLHIQCLVNKNELVPPMALVQNQKCSPLNKIKQSIHYNDLVLLYHINLTQSKDQSHAGHEELFIDFDLCCGKVGPDLFAVCNPLKLALSHGVSLCT